MGEDSSPIWTSPMWTLKALWKRFIWPQLDWHKRKVPPTHFSQNFFFKDTCFYWYNIYLQTDYATKREGTQAGQLLAEVHPQSKCLGMPVLPPSLASISQALLVFFDLDQFQPLILGLPLELCPETLHQWWPMATTMCALCHLPTCSMQLCPGWPRTQGKACVKCSAHC